MESKKSKYAPIEIIGAKDTSKEVIDLSNDPPLPSPSKPTRKTTIEDAYITYGEKVLEVLPTVFGHDNFRQGQKEVMFAALAGKILSL